MNRIQTMKIRRDTKRVFLKKGTCSRTFFHILDRHFGQIDDAAEQAADPLAGGILQQGYQCGMLWGAALAAGAQAYRRRTDPDQAVPLAMHATRCLMDSFVNRARSADCSDITHTDWTRKFSILKYLLSGKMITCFRLADRWAPEAIAAAERGLSVPAEQLPVKCRNCAVEILRRLGCSDAESVTVAGLAGGLGLSGNACGALAAVVWKHTLDRVRAHNYKYSLSDPLLAKILQDFYKATDYEMECRIITGRSFASQEEHSAYIADGGCRQLLDALAQAN